MLIYFCSALTVFFLQAKKKKKVKEEKHARFLKNLEKLYE
jgi:hypothetical protein